MRQDDSQEIHAPQNSMDQSMSPRARGTTNANFREYLLQRIENLVDRISSNSAADDDEFKPSETIIFKQDNQGNAS